MLEVIDKNSEVIIVFNSGIKKFDEILSLQRNCEICEFRNNSHENGRRGCCMIILLYIVFQKSGSYSIGYNEHFLNPGKSKSSNSSSVSYYFFF